MLTWILDLALVLIFVLCVCIGRKRGFIKTMTGVLAFFAAAAVAFLLHKSVANVVYDKSNCKVKHLYTSSYLHLHVFKSSTMLGIKRNFTDPVCFQSQCHNGAISLFSYMFFSFFFSSFNKNTISKHF